MEINNFQKEINRISDAINKIRTSGDLCFAMLSDSILSDSSIAARKIIRAVDEKVGFDCLVHLGDILRGNNPENISRWLLREELAAYQNVVGNGKVFVTQGEQDGYRDESFCGQLVCGIMRDDIWHEDTAYIDRYADVHREGDKPYYYVDFPEYTTRMIFLCSSFYDYDEENMFFERYPAFDLKQLSWLKNVALKAQEGWKVLLFSHAMPKSRFDIGKDPFIYCGFAGEKFLNLLQRAQREEKISIVCWCSGHYLYDCEAVVASINHMIIGSMAPISCGEVKQEGARTNSSRELGTIEEVLWDAVVLKADERKMYAFRFGAGIDRVISY